MSVVLISAAEADRQQLDTFLAHSFRARKAQFLREHGDWWHRGAENRWVLVEGGEIRGYCAVMPSAVRVGTTVVDAAWWVDLVIDPAARGRKLQRLFDDQIRARPLTLGFPNAVAATIHRRHGWGVRENLQMRLLPIAPLTMPAAASLPRVARLLAAPWLWLGGRLLGAGSPGLSPQSLDHTVLEHFAQLPAAGTVSTAHNTESLTWRYLESPWRDQYQAVLDSRAGVIVRLLEVEGVRVMRILELAGKAEDLGKVLAGAVAAARAAGATQVTGLAANPKVARALGKAGLFVRTRARSCWYSGDRALLDQIASGHHHWSLGDADHDEP